MLLIKSVEAVEVKGEYIQVVINRPSVHAFDPHAPPEQNIETEVVRGHRFVNAEGKEFVIGMTREVRKVLHLPYDVYDDMSNYTECLREELALQQSIQNRLKNRLKVIKEMGFWERLNRIFVGFYTLSIK